LERRDIISQQANILMAENNIGAARQAKKASDTLKGIPIISAAIVQIQKFGVFRGEATGQKAFDHGGIIRVTGDQRADAETRPCKGLACVNGLHGKAHSFKIASPAQLRKVILFWRANEPARLR
jgi:hypothetical protein